MVSRATKDKIARALDYQAEREETVEVDKPAETKKEKKQKAGKMDDDTSSEDEKKKKEQEEAQDPPQIDSGVAQPVAEVNLIDDLLGMGTAE